MGIADVKMGNQNDVLGVYSSSFGELLLHGNGGIDRLGVDEFSMFVDGAPTPMGFEDDFPGDQNEMGMLAESGNPTYETAIDLFETLGLAF